MFAWLSGCDMNVFQMFNLGCAFTSHFCLNECIIFFIRPPLGQSDWFHTIENMAKNQ